MEKREKNETIFIKILKYILERKKCSKKHDCINFQMNNCVDYTLLFEMNIRPASIINEIKPMIEKS